MKRELIIRAWKDPEFRASLSTEERASLPECPAGTAFTELDERELADAVGGGAAYYLEEGCICSDWTMPTTFTRTRLEDPRVNYRQLDLAVNNLRYR